MLNKKPSYRGDDILRGRHPIDPTGKVFGDTHWPMPAAHETTEGYANMAKKQRTKWDEDTRAAIQSEVDTPVKPVAPRQKQWAEGETVKHRGDKCVVVKQNGNWVTIDCSGSVYKVYSDILTGPKEKVVAATAKSPEKAKAQQDANEVLDGCVTREQYLKAVAKWPVMVEYVQQLVFNAGPGMMKMRVANKLRAVIRKGN